MNPVRKSGKRGRKTIRSVKRARYAVSFEKRYHMSRRAFRELRKTDKAFAHEIRMKALR